MEKWIAEAWITSQQNACWWRNRLSQCEHDNLVEIVAGQYDFEHMDINANERKADSLAHKTNQAEMLGKDKSWVSAW